MASPLLQVGAVINFRYEVRGHLGGGTNGVVYEVFDLRQREVSALKLLVGTPPTAVWEESAILTQVGGDYLLPIRNADLAAGVPFIVTAVATNGTIGKGMRAGVGVAPTQAATWIQQASRGLARIHDLGLLHNDIKPENIFLGDDNQALVGDLGLACLRDTNGMGHFAGTLTTVAPEVALVGAAVPSSQWPSARPTSVASDIYSLAATFYMLVAGRPIHAFPSNDMVANFSIVANETPTDIRDVAPHVPKGLGATIMRALSKDPVNRPESASALDAGIGSRPRQRRSWVRVAPHPGHTSCFQGVRGGSKIEVCAIPTGTGTQHRIVCQHQVSGRKAANPTNVSRASALPRALRVVLRDLA